MRVVTPEAVRFVAAMDDCRAEAETRRTAFRAAAERHVARVSQCQTGQAPEQHLWELQLIQRRRGAALGVYETPALYRCPGWLRMREDYLSTSSTMPSVNIEYGGFGPTGSRCIGVAYMLLPDRLRFHLSARGRAGADMVVFSGQLQRAIGELRALLSPEQREA